MRINKKKTFFLKKIANVCWKTVLDKKPTGLFVPGPRKSAPRGTSKPINREGRKKEEQTPKTTKVSFLSAQQKRKNQDIKSHVVVGGGGRARRGHKLWRNNTTKTIRYPSSSTLQLALLLFLHLAFSGRKRKRVENFLSKRRRLFFFLHPASLLFLSPFCFLCKQQQLESGEEEKMLGGGVGSRKALSILTQGWRRRSCKFPVYSTVFFPSLRERERENEGGFTFEENGEESHLFWMNCIRWEEKKVLSKKPPFPHQRNGSQEEEEEGADCSFFLGVWQMNELHINKVKEKKLLKKHG